MLDVMTNHRSVRRYKSDPVPEEALQKILLAASRASSSGNMQAYSMIVTSDPELRRQLYPLHFEQNMVLDAPIVLTFCADFHRMRKWLELSRAPMNFDNVMSFMIASIDAVLASQNAALAAEAQGLGICYMGTTLANCEQIAQVLECPSHVVPVVGFSLGYPDETGPLRDRLPLDALVHREKYNVGSDPENQLEIIRAAYKSREEKGWERYMQQPELRERVLSEGVENLAQVYTKLKYTRESHQVYSQTILDCLKTRGFFEN